MKTVILDYALGNLFNVKRAVEHVGGTSVISSDKTEIEGAGARELEYLDIGGGLAVSYDTEHPIDVDAFAAGLQQLVEGKELRTKVAQNGYDFVRSNYAKERLLEDIKGLYAELLSAQPGKVESRSAEGVESRA